MKSRINVHTKIFSGRELNSFFSFWYFMCLPGMPEPAGKRPCSLYTPFSVMPSSQVSCANPGTLNELHQQFPAGGLHAVWPSQNTNPIVALPCLKSFSGSHALTINSNSFCSTQLLLLLQASPDAMLPSPPCQIPPGPPSSPATCMGPTLPFSQLTPTHPWGLSSNITFLSEAVPPRLNELHSAGTHSLTASETNYLTNYMSLVTITSTALEFSWGQTTCLAYLRVLGAQDSINCNTGADWFSELTALTEAVSQKAYLIIYRPRFMHYLVFQVCSHCD